MGKILAIDYGTMRCGLAITDELKMIASPLKTVATSQIMQELRNLEVAEKIERLVIGLSRNLDGTASDTGNLIDEFVVKLQKTFPGKPISRVNEMFTSKMASQSLVAGGMKKGNRQKKENLDMVSAAIILQTYLEYGETL